MLYVGVGEAHTSSNSQSLSTPLGKILRIDPAGFPDIVPADNPFVSTPGARGEIWALGLRNPFTFAVDPLNGEILVNDVGQASREEINLGVSGANFGWPTCEGACSNPSFINPVHAYTHGDGCAITGGAFYRGAGFPSHMDGSYFFTDFCSDWIRRLDNGDVMHPFATGVAGVVDLKVGPDQALYYLTRSSGAVRRIAFAQQLPPDPPANVVVY
jgi:glucose/arabinose dehydrogenase